MELTEPSLKLPQPLFFVVSFPGHSFTDEELEGIDRENDDFRIELNSNGDLEFMPPPFPETSRKNIELDYQLMAWSKKDKTGLCFESSAKFTLPNGAKRMPDVSWILKDRYYALSKTERSKRFARIVPDFVIELRSVSDRLPILERKMAEYIANGVRLGWLIDPETERVQVYRADGSVETLEKPATISGEDVLVGFVLDLAEIW
ncbi:MAG: Uma2 family endonuclease [Acidobacteria bacterium]|nr:Uma2 family endonuclease [Acidobacteriota bacterium]MBK8809144.1 Uma2 family endonuclease [Acidobacteriota bacterium]